MDYDKYTNHLPWSRDVATRKAYNEETSRLTSMFKTDALKEVGLTGHPKADKAFDLAWERGHHSGYSEVFSELIDLAELLLD